MSAVKQLPAVARIRGIALNPNKDIKKSSVDIQWTDDAGQWYGLTMGLQDAQYLLNMLEAASRESGFDYRRRDPTKN